MPASIVFDEERPPCLSVFPWMANCVVFAHHPSALSCVSVAEMYPAPASDPNWAPGASEEIIGSLVDVFARAGVALCGDLAQVFWAVPHDSATQALVRRGSLQEVAGRARNQGSVCEYPSKSATPTLAGICCLHSEKPLSSVAPSIAEGNNPRFQ